jgi:hypothetical protein
VEEVIVLNQVVLYTADVTLLDIGACTRKIMYEPHIRPNAGVWVGQQWNCGFVLIRGKTFFSFLNIKAGFGAHPPSYSKGVAALSQVGAVGPLPLV